MKWRGDQIKNANLSALFLSSFLTLFLCLSAFLSQAWISSQHSHLKSLGGKSRPLGSLAPWLDNSFLAWRGQRWAVWETGSHWGSRGDVFLEEVGGGVSCGRLAWSEHWQLPNSVVPARPRCALTHYATHRKRPEALEAWRYKAPDRFIRKR